MMETLDRYEMRASVLLNSAVCTHYPQIIDAGREREWEWLAHGQDNSTFHTGLKLEDERRVLKEIVETLSRATGQAPKGWLGPALTETFETPKLLREQGLTYLLDWCADHEPFPAQCAGHDFCALWDRAK